MYGYVSFYIWLCFLFVLFFLENSAEMPIFRAFCEFDYSFGNILAFFL